MCVCVCVCVCSACRDRGLSMADLDTGVLQLHHSPGSSLPGLHQGVRGSHSDGGQWGVVMVAMVIVARCMIITPSIGDACHAHSPS